jgi:S1-C subfamily serine protease
LVTSIVLVIAAAAAFGGVALSRHNTKKPANSSSSGQSVSHTRTVSAAKTYASFESEYASLKGAVVKIETVGCDGNQYEGSGFAIDAHHIVTAGHVVEQSQSITVAVGGNPLPTQIIGLDVSGDLALLHSDAAIPGPYIPLEAHDPPVGERVAAIGFPLGGGLTMTQGSVSALGQDITVNDTLLKGLVQTDTPLNHGNSGGPLIALDGRANGIVDALNTQANATGYAISPKYAAVEVDNWIAHPESHPLPMCSSTNPLGSVSATPTPSTPSTPSSGPGVAIPTVALSSQGTTSMYIVQSLATALANHQWDQARTIYPLLESDSQLAIDYGALQASTVVVTGENDGSTTVGLTGAYVAWETVNGDQRTSIYCIGWTVDPNDQQVVNQASIDSDLVDYQSGWADPSSVVTVVESQCVP